MTLFLTLSLLFLAGLVKGTSFICPAFINMVLAITARLIWQNYR